MMDRPEASMRWNCLTGCSDRSAVARFSPGLSLRFVNEKLPKRQGFHTVAGRGLGLGKAHTH